MHMCGIPRDRETLQCFMMSPRRQFIATLLRSDFGCNKFRKAFSKIRSPIRIGESSCATRSLSLQWLQANVEHYIRFTERRYETISSKLYRFGHIDSLSLGMSSIDQSSSWRYYNIDWLQLWYGYYLGLPNTWVGWTFRLGWCLLSNSHPTCYYGLTWVIQFLIVTLHLCILLVSYRIMANSSGVSHCVNLQFFWRFMLEHELQNKSINQRNGLLYWALC